MKKILLAMMAAAVAAGPVSAQSQMKAVAPVAKKSSYVPQGTTKLGEKVALTSRSSRGDEVIDAKVLSNMGGWDRQVYGATLGGEANLTLKVATMYDPALLGRFNGNTIKTIKTVIGPNCKDISAFIVNGLTGDVVWQSKKLASYHNTTTKSKPVDVDCDYVIDAAVPIFVGFQFTMKSSETVIACVNNVSANGLLLDNGRGFMDLSAANGINAYIDCVTEGGAGLKANDVNMINVTGARAQANGDYVAYATFINYGTNPVKSVKSSYAVGEEVQESELSTEENQFPYMMPIQVSINTKAPEKGARYVQNYSILQVNGVDDEFSEMNQFTQIPDNEAYNILTTTEVAYPHAIVMEQFTGAWCGWCPRGHVAMEKAQKKFGDKFIGVAIHYNDPLACADYEPLIAYTGGNFPGAMLNRLSLACFDPYYGVQGPATKEGEVDGDILNDIDAVMTIPTEALIGISSKLNGNDIEVSSKFKFALSAPGNHYSVAYVLTEDGLTGIPQNNYFHKSQGKIQSADQLPDDLKFLFTEGTNGKYLPTFNNVARSIVDVAGIEGSLDDVEIKNGEVITHNAVLAVPEGVKTENLNVIAILIDNFSDEIVTAVKAKLGETIWDEAAGVEGVEAENAAVEVANGAINVVGNGLVAVYSLDGKVLRSANVNGNISIPCEGLKGVYVVRVVNGNNVIAKKVML